LSGIWIFYKKNRDAIFCVSINESFDGTIN
jgi:hypothetical protein